jgi:hypothetical protein
MRKSYCLAASIFLLFAGLAIIVSAVEMPQFQSGASDKVGMDVDFNALYTKANSIYDVMEHDNQHIIWKFSQTSGDWAFVQKGGVLAVASTSEMNMARRNRLKAELNDISSTIKAAGGTISGSNEPITYYTDKSKVYRVISQDFDGNFVYSLNVPNCTINQAMLTITGSDAASCYATERNTDGEHYFVDGKEVSGCDLNGFPVKPYGISCGAYSIPPVGSCTKGAWVEVNPVDITKNVPPGLHSINGNEIDNRHTMIIEAITTPSSKPIVLYNKDKTIWVEDTNSKSVDELNALITQISGQKPT